MIKAEKQIALKSKCGAKSHVCASNPAAENNRN